MHHSRRRDARRFRDVRLLVGSVALAAAAVRPLNVDLAAWRRLQAFARD